MNFKTLLVFSVLLCSVTASAQLTRVQFINNCADVNLPAIDIYLDGTLLINDLGFRHSNAYLDLPAGTTVNIGIAEQTSLTAIDTFINLTYTFSPSNVYLVILNGLVSTTGYNPIKPFSLDIYNLAREGAPANRTDVLFVNGSTDAPALDVRTDITTMANDLAYGDFSDGYYSLSSTGYYIFRLTNPTGSKTTHLFEADFMNLPAVTNKAVVVLTSGFLNPAGNSNGAALGLWLAEPGGGPLLELPVTTTAEKLARVQLIHNSADTGVGKVDVYVDNQKIIDSIDFRHATAYMDAYADVAMNVGIARAGSGTQFFNTSITLDSGKVYAAILNGIESDTNYKPRPALSIDLYNGAKEEAGVATGTDVLYAHGATDAPLYDIRNAGNQPVFSDIIYNNFSTGYGTISQGNLAVIKVDTGNGNVFMEKYEIKITDWNLAGKTTTVVFSGFAVPDSNSGGPALGFWAALPEGGPLRQLPVYTTVDNVSKQSVKIDLYPNPAGSEIMFDEFADCNILITDVTGRIVMQFNDFSGNRIDVSPLTSGNYLLLVQDEQGIVYHSKFMKQ